jgi:hypothetical protein
MENNKKIIIFILITIISLVYSILILQNPVNSYDNNSIIENQKQIELNSDYNINNSVVLEPKRPMPIAVPIPVPIIANNKIEPNQKWTKEQITNRIIEVFGENYENALKIAQCESGIRDNAIGDKNLNPSSYGVFQIRAFINRGTPEQLLDPEYNIQFAYRMSGGGTNFGAWTCKKVL